MSFDFKTATPGSASASALIFGAESQVAASPSIYNTTGSGTVVLSTGATLVTPTLGVASATSINKVAITAPATSATLTIANGKTLTASNSLTLAGTDSTTMTFPSTSATIARTDAGQTFTGNQVVSSGSFGLSGNISTTAWTTSGVRYKNVSATLTDTSSSGTVAAAYTDIFGGNTIAASNATTFTNYYTMFVSAPTAGSNVTFTNSYALGTSGSVLLGGPTLQLGAVDAASAVAQTLQVQSVVAGTSNTAGANFTIAGSKGTGTGVGGSLIFQVAPAGTTGTSQNALATALTIDSTKTATFATTMVAYNAGDSTYANASIRFGTGQSYFAAGSNQIYFGSSAGGYGGTLWYGGIIIGSANTISWESAGSGTTRDLFISRAAAATAQFGGADANPPVAQILQVQNASGTNISGADWTHIGSLNTGSGTPGKIIFKTGTVGASSSTKSTAVAAWAIDGNQALYPAGTLATNMTNGFLNIPGAAGAASGTPGNTTGFPIYWDSTNLQLYIYTGGAWKKSAAFT